MFHFWLDDIDHVFFGSLVADEKTAPKTVVTATKTFSSNCYESVITVLELILQKVFIY